MLRSHIAPLFLGNLFAVQTATKGLQQRMARTCATRIDSHLRHLVFMITEKEMSSP